MRTSGGAALLPQPDLHRTGPGGGKNLQKEEPTALSLPPSLRARGALLFTSLDWRALTPRRWIFLLSSECDTDFSKSYNTVCPRLSKPWPAEGALMSVGPSLCCDETKNRGAYTCLTIGFHIYMLIYDICFSLSDLLHSLWQTLHIYIHISTKDPILFFFMTE